MTARFICRSAAVAAVAAVCPAMLPAQNASETRTDTRPTLSFGADYSYQTFNGSIDPWQLAALSLTRRTTQGSLIARVNYAGRFGSSGGQVEVDAYPRLTKNAYAYLNLGYSTSSIFPAWRSGGELFLSLPQAWEASLGYRQLRFSGSPVTLFTGAVGKYVGNYWFSLRPFVRPKNTGTSASASLTARRYFEDGDHYLGVRVGYGSTPSDQLPDAAALTRTHAVSGAVQGSGGIRTNLLGTWSLGYDNEELDAGTIRRSWTLAAGFRMLF